MLSTSLVILQGSPAVKDLCLTILEPELSCSPLGDIFHIQILCCLVCYHDVDPPTSQAHLAVIVAARIHWQPVNLRQTCNSHTVLQACLFLLLQALSHDGLLIYSE